MYFVEQVPIDETVIFVFFALFLKPDHMDIVFFETFKDGMNFIDFLAAVFRVLIELVDIGSLLDSQAVVDLHIGGKKNNVNVLKVSVVFVDFVLQDVSQFY